MKTIEEKVRELGGVWPFNPQYQTIYWDRNLGCSVAYSSPDTVKICTRTEFEECARRLRNEPDWKDAPNWAVAYAQDSDGKWCWFSVEPLTGPECWVRQVIVRHRLAGKGEVIGDWRDTLRLRPEEKKMGSEMGNEKNWLKDVRNAFTKNAEEFDSLLMSVLNRIESHEELEESEPTGDWHVKGEFPPVGAEFKFSVNGKNWEERVMLFNDGITCLMASRKHPSCRWHYKCDDPELQFRPLQNEREQLIDEAISVVDDARTPWSAIKRLADADMLKMPEDK